jgi:hypothetical protein
VSTSAPEIEQLARKLWGDPNREHSTREELRFGTHGSKSVKLRDRTWFDHEANEGGGYRDLFKLVHGVFPPNGDASIVATYDYADADGKLVFQVVRKAPKTFRQRRPDGNGGWVWDMHGIERIPYRLPELLRASPHAVVFVCEGEKDCDNLRERGLIATTNPGGAGKWRPNLSEHFRGRNVVVLADNDTQARLPDGTPRWHPDGRPVLPGQDHAADVATKLRGIAASVQVVTLPDLPPKGDVSDWLAAGGTAEELERIAAEVVHQARIAEIEQPDRDTARRIEQPVRQESDALGIWDAGDDDYQIPPRGWLLGTTFCRRFLSSLVADGGVGKTAVRLAQLISLAIGRSLTGEKVFLRCKVLIVSLEDDRDELRRRVYAVLRHYNITAAEVRGWLFLSAPKGLRLAEMKDGVPAAGELEGLLRKAIVDREIDVVSLDPFIKSHGLEENSNGAIDYVCTLLAKVAIEYNCAVDLPHHTKKGIGGPGDADRGRGASAMKDAARLVYTLTPMSSEEAEQFGVSEAGRRGLVRLDSGKVNIAPPSAAATWFRLVGVPLENGGGIYPAGDNVQTVEPWQPPETWGAMDHPLLNRILDDIEAGMPNGSRYSHAPKAEDRAAWQVVITNAPDKTEKQAREIIRTWIKSGTLYVEDYEDPNQRKTRTGLRVNATKRPS